MISFVVDIIVNDGGDAIDQEHLVDLQRDWLNAGHWLVAAEHIWDMTLEALDSTCDGLGPENICAGPVCAPNPAPIVCRGMAKPVFVVIAYLLLVGATIAYQVIDDIYTLATLGENQAVYGYYYSRATYHNTLGYNDWNRRALEAIRTNMKDQHHEMKRQLQERHKDIANHVGEDIADAQNTLGHAIVTSQNEIGKSIIDSQNALGEAIVDSQNANGQAIVDAQNYITSQHNTLGEWLHTSLCQLYEKEGGTCEEFIGPLEEDQAFIPMELSWPAGQPTMIEMLEQIQSTLLLGSTGDSKDGSEITVDAPRVLGAATSIQVDGVESKVDALAADMQRKVDGVESKVGAIESSMKNIEEKLSKLMNLLVKE